MVDEVLHRGEVRVPLGRQAVLPPHVLVAAVPVGIVERRIGQHVIGLEVFVQVAAERVGVFGAEVAFDAANGQVHHRQPPRRRVGLLTVDRDVADPPAMLFDKLFALHEHARRAAAGIVDPTLVRREHLDQHADHAARRVELPAVLPLGTGELR